MGTILVAIPTFAYIIIMFTIMIRQWTGMSDRQKKKISMYIDGMEHMEERLVRKLLKKVTKVNKIEILENQNGAILITKKPFNKEKIDRKLKSTNLKLLSYTEELY